MVKIGWTNVFLEKLLGTSFGKISLTNFVENFVNKLGGTLGRQISLTNWVQKWVEMSGVKNCDKKIGKK